MIKKYYNNMIKHNKNLSKYACKDSDVIRFKNIKEDYRSPYFRDIDKILYTLSYPRYSDKTQVYSLSENDMVTDRMVHIQLVSKIARTIGRGLNLNEDLIEAASLGHDLGHAPFGHLGESFLNEISLEKEEGYFNHNVQSVRILNEIENNGDGVNISLQVLDAILCHNGEKLKQKYEPMKKDIDEFTKEYNDTYKNKLALNNITSMTLEGCVVRISDVIAYVGKDLEDSIRLKKINREDIPSDIVSILGNNNSKIIDTIVSDILENSIDKNYIFMSSIIYESLNKLIKFNYENIYLLALNSKEKEEIKSMFNKLFDLYYSQIKNNLTNEDIFANFLDNMNDKYIKNTTIARKIIDYISGMTDIYFINQYKKYFDL